MSTEDDNNDNDDKSPPNKRNEKYPFEELATDEEKVQWMMAEYKALQEVGPDGIDFSGKTAMWVAYERYLESLMEEPLFVDPLAQYFMEPYGKRLSVAMMVAMKGVFDPTDEIGLGFHGHIRYTAGRTKFINETIQEWISDGLDEGGSQQKKKQVLNLGAGLDTRVFWLEALKRADLYIEVDTGPVLAYKEKILKQLKDNEGVPLLLCKRQVVAMDFSKETIACLPSKHNFETKMPTCWILEGLVMYLTKEAVDQLLKDMTELSASGSLAIINFSKTPASHPDSLDNGLVAGNGWKRTVKTYFGDDNFNYGKYPEGKPANKELGFCVYLKE